MAQPELIEHDDRLEFHFPLRARARLALGLCALFPLIAPYELLVRAGWDHRSGPFFILAALISAGAVALSAALAFAALAGLSSRLIFDRRAGTVCLESRAPVVRRSRRTYPLSSVRSVEVGVRDWSDGDPSYHLRVEVADGAPLESGPSRTRAEIEAISSRVNRFLGDATTKARP